MTGVIGMRVTRWLGTTLLLAALGASVVSGCAKSAARSEADQQANAQKQKSFMQTKMKGGAAGGTEAPKSGG